MAAPPEAISTQKMMYSEWFICPCQPWRGEQGRRQRGNGPPGESVGRSIAFSYRGLHLSQGKPHQGAFLPRKTVKENTMNTLGVGVLSASNSQTFPSFSKKGPKCISARRKAMISQQRDHVVRFHLHGQREAHTKVQESIACGGEGSE